MNNGLEVEKKYSLKFHQLGLPLLVSPALLRSRNLGQIDLARIVVDNHGWLIEIAEVKSSMIGIEQMMYSQRSRLFSSQHFLSGIFGHRGKLTSLGKTTQSI